MHAGKIALIVIGSLWAYTFIGVHVMRGILSEHKGMRDALMQVIVILMWPIWPIVEVFERN